LNSLLQDTSPIAFEDSIDLEENIYFGKMNNELRDINRNYEKLPNPQNESSESIE